MVDDVVLAVEPPHELALGLGAVRPRPSLVGGLLRMDPSDDERGLAVVRHGVQRLERDGVVYLGGLEGLVGKVVGHLPAFRFPPLVDRAERGIGDHGIGDLPHPFPEGRVEFCWATWGFGLVTWSFGGLADRFLGRRDRLVKPRKASVARARPHWSLGSTGSGNSQNPGIRARAPTGKWGVTIQIPGCTTATCPQCADNCLQREIRPVVCGRGYLSRRPRAHRVWITARPPARWRARTPYRSASAGSRHCP